jgi:Na+/proline symporter
LLHQIGGWSHAQALLNAPGDLQVFDSGQKAGAGFFPNVKNVLETEYTLWAAFLGSTFTTMATHGTDQDMAQRMLTAKNHHRSRLALICSGFMDIPINFAFLLIGILLWVYFQTHHDPNLPTKNPHVFAYYILHELPVGVRGLLVAGLFATAMGSLSTALNALATSFTEDWYQPYIRPQATPGEVLKAARWSTVFFAALLILIGSATAWTVISNPKARIIPIVLGIFGYTYGSLLGVFLCGMLTKARGSNHGNFLAMICGFIVVAILSGLHNDLLATIGVAPVLKFDWLPVIEFPWRIMFGTVVTFSIAILFRTPREQLELAQAHLREMA